MSSQPRKGGRQLPDRPVTQGGIDWEKPRPISETQAVEIAARKAEARAKLVSAEIVKA